MTSTQDRLAAKSALDNVAKQEIQDIGDAGAGIIRCLVPENQDLGHRSSKKLSQVLADSAGMKGCGRSQSRKAITLEKSQKLPIPLARRREASRSFTSSFWRSKNFLACARSGASPLNPPIRT